MEGFNKISSQSIGTGLICELVLTKSAAWTEPQIGRGTLLSQLPSSLSSRISPLNSLHILFNQKGIKSIRLLNIWIDPSVQRERNYNHTIKLSIFIESDCLNIQL